MMVSRDVHILLAGGAPEEATALMTVLKALETSARIHLRHLDDSQQVLACLRGEAPFRKASPASLLLLDVDGLADGGSALLSNVKGDAKLVHIPVVLLATHQSENELARAYDQGANCCVSKPVDAQQLMDALQATNAFWLTVAKLPPE